MDREMVLRGFAGHVTDLRGRMRLCHPILSPSNDETRLMLASDLDWLANGRGLEPVDREDVPVFGTLWREIRSTIQPALGVAVAGETFGSQVFEAIGSAGIADLPFEWDSEVGCWIAIVRKGQFDQYGQHLGKQARAIFDYELPLASRVGRLSPTGAAALFVLRRTPRRRTTDVAIRELVAARVETDIDLYRRLLAVRSVELGVSEERLGLWVEKHMLLIRFAGLPVRSRPARPFPCGSQRRFKSTKRIKFLEREYGKQERVRATA